MPAEQSDPPQSSSVQKAAVSQANRQRVLCIDNNAFFRNFVSRFLAEVGCEVAAAASAGEALSLIRKYPNDYSLVIAAHWLPDMEGVELIKTLRSIPYAGRIVITAAELPSHQRTIYESMNVYSILQTPVGHSELVRILTPSPRYGS